MAAVTFGDWTAVLALASLSAVSTALGVWAALRIGARDTALVVGLGFSVGVMATVSVVELLPEAAADMGLLETLLVAFLGAGLLAALNVAIPHMHLFVEDRGIGGGSVRVAYLVAFGLVLHDFPEGFAMANSYLASPGLGLVVAIAILVHNVPEEFTMALPAVLADRRRFLVRAAVVSAAAEPAGALLGLVGVSVFPELNARFLALAAGAMLFVSFHELLPLARRYGRTRALMIGAGAGAMLIGGLRLLLLV